MTPTDTTSTLAATVEKRDASSTAISAHDPEQHALAKLSSVKKHVLLLVFSIATFVDVCNVSGVGIAVAKIAVDIQLQVSQIVWIITAYSLTFASLLLFAGRLSDLFPAWIVFMAGFVGLGVISLVTSFVTTNKYGFLILRALGGMAGAMTIPSAYHMIVHMFPDPTAKRKKLSLLAIAASLGNVLGMVLSALTMLASYHWFFRLIAIICFTFSGVTFLILPRFRASGATGGVSRIKRLDIIGVLIMFFFLVCFLLGLTQGPIDGWTSAAFLAPFIISLLLAPFFFVWEARINPQFAVLPATVWKIKNMVISSLVVLLPFSFWLSSQLLFSTYWQVVEGWKPLHVAVAVLPQGIAAMLAGAVTQFSPVVIQNPRISIPVGATFVMIGEALMYFSDGGHGMDYWRYCFPGFVIGSAGAILMFMAAGVNLVTYCPPEMGGVAGAWNQTMAQIGAAIALAVQSGLEGKTLHDWRYNARSFWFEFAAFGAVAAAYAIFYRKPLSPDEEHEAARERMRVVEARFGNSKPAAQV